MDDTPTTPQRSPHQSGRATPEERRQREAEALRANLAKRKAWQRRTRGEGPSPSDRQESG